MVLLEKEASMKPFVISRLASDVWNMLIETHGISASQIERILNISESELFTVLGWLAHDKNIFMSQHEDDWYISNKQPNFFFSL